MTNWERAFLIGASICIFFLVFIIIPMDMANNRDIALRKIEAYNKCKEIKNDKRSTKK